MKELIVKILKYIVEWLEGDNFDVEVYQPIWVLSDEYLPEGAKTADLHLCLRYANSAIILDFDGRMTGYEVKGVPAAAFTPSHLYSKTNRYCSPEKETDTTK